MAGLKGGEGAMAAGVEASPDAGAPKGSPAPVLSSKVSAVDIGGVEPVVRRVVAARVADRAVVDDLVQDALERLMAARERLAPGMIVAYAVVTARNVTVDYGRRAARRAAAEPRLADLSVPEQPDEALVRAEEQAAMIAALARLPAPERAALVAHEVDGVPLVHLTDEPVSAATMRVRLSRTRAKLRVEYAIALRNVELPSRQCRPTLFALAGGDRGRSEAPAASQHLLHCATCASLSDPLVRRHRGMVAALPLLLAWRLITRTAKAHPAVTAATAAAAAAGVAVATVTATAPAPTGPRPAPAAVKPAGPAPSAVVPTAVSLAALTMDGRPFVTGGAPLTGNVGTQVVATAAPVEAVVTHNGFWVGENSTNRLWVELVGPLRSMEVHVGERISFSAPLVAQPPDYAAAVGVDAAGGAAQLTAQGAHVSLLTTALSVVP